MLESDLDKEAIISSEEVEHEAVRKRKVHVKVQPTHFQAKYCHSPSKLQTPKCPSIKDELSQIDLPKGKPHVCYLASDGKRHCYTLDSLYRVAISKHHASSSTAVQLLQPPGFICPMEDDLIDQIASRFGRQALNIEQTGLYKEMQLKGECEHVRRYMDNLIGTTDLYCCPVCYSEAYRRQGNLVQGMAVDDNDDSEEGKEDEEESKPYMDNLRHDPFLFRDDPITILTNVGLETASTFSFQKLKGVQNHVKFVHGVDHSGINNGLFQRFQIRASDGLLQQWPGVKKLWRLQGKRFKNAMWAYWASDGNSESYKHLSRLIDRGRLKGEQSGEFGSSFSQSFPNRAKKVWNELSEPFLKPKYIDVSNMIDDKCLGEGVKPRPLLDDQESDPEECMVEHLREINKEHGDDDSSNEDEGHSASESSPSSSSEGESFSEEEDESGSDESVEEVDSWLEAKMVKPTAARQRDRRNSQDSEDESLFDSGPVQPKIVSPHKMILDSDDES